MLRTRKRIGAALLAAALVFSQLGATAYAVESPAGTGLCEHHTAHDDACGYVEAIPGHDCGHKHTPECYTDELICGMDEDVEQTATGSDAGHTHTDGCYQLDCQHEHDADCGYIEAVPGTLCGYVCEVCAGEPDKDSGKENSPASENDLTPPKETGSETVSPEGAETVTVTAFDKLDEAVRFQTVPVGTKFNDLTLPATLGASGYVVSDDTEPVPTHIQIEGVTWKATGEDDTPAAYEEGREKPCNYYFQPGVPEGYELAESAVLPKIEVRYGWGNRANTSDYNADDVAAFQAILAAHPESSVLSGVDNSNPASWATAGLVQWDTSSPKRITELFLSLKGLTGTLDVGNLTKLTVLYCKNNQLGTLDGLGNLTNLTKLYCNNNQLDTLDGLGNLTNLQILDCSINQLSGTLDVGNLTNLTDLYCKNNQLDTLDGLGNLTNLQILNCSTNQLSGTLDVGNLTNLTDLFCSTNQLSGTLDVGNLTNLQNLDCSTNQLSGTLDVRNLTGLTYLRCDNNPYTSFTTRDGYTLTMTPAVNGKVWLTGYNKSSNTVELTAKPDSGYAFQAWTGLPAGAPNSQTTSFTLTGDATVKAAFVGTDATLKSLSLSSGTLTPAFDPATTSYTANVGNSVTNVTITATANDTKANVAGNGTKTLVEGVNTFTVTVTAENGSTASYTVTITRAGAAASTDATLKSLFLSSGTLAPAFDQATTSYTANVDNSVSNVTITATANDTKANVAGAGVKTLNVGDNPFTVTVTAEDGTPKSYTITITRAAAATTGGSSGTSRHYIITTLEPPKPDNPVLAVIELPVTVGNGTATGAADDGRTASALAEAGRDAKAKTNGIAVQYDAKTSLTYDGFSIVIQRATLDRLIDAKVKYVTLNTGIVDMTFDLAALIELQKQATGDITLTAVRETGLAGDALSAVGSRPAYRLSVGYTGADGKAATVTSFGAGRVTVGLAYQPAATEQTGSLYLVYSADGKGAEWLYQSSYDKNSGNVIGDLGHFSVYGVGYKTAPAFTDTVNHWAKADIDFVVSRGLFSGTSETTFSPDSTITRGMFVTALGRLAGIDPAGYPSSSRFTDVPATAYYAPFVEWAASKGIVSGTGEGSFSPDAAITREQMALIMRQYADKLGYTLPVAREAVTFTDENQITGNMKDAVRAIQQAGIMSGKGNNRFGPKDAATRAEAAVVLRRFVEVVIDRDTAGGWGQNDAGRWLYYLDGKPVTGWKQIESKWYCFDAAGLMEYGGWKQIGGKWYYFYPDGSMAADTKIDGYEIGRDGARKDKE